jgi:rubrerythrin
MNLKHSELHVLSICCKIEETCADMYRYLAQVYANTPSASELWMKTAQEEDSHAEQFRLAYHLHGNGMKSLKSDETKAKKLLENIQSIFDSVKSSPPTLKAALKNVIKMEDSMAEYHMNALVEYDDDNLKRLFYSMKSNDNEHIQMLERAYIELGSIDTPNQ